MLRVRQPAILLPPQPIPIPTNLYGVFDAQLVNSCWFDAQMLPEGWFLEDLIQLIAAINSIRYGNNTTTRFYYGANQVTKIYYGTNLVYSS